MDEIEQFKQENNGNFLKYSQKEILGGIFRKLEKIELRLSKGDISFTEIQTSMKFYKRLIWGIVSALGGLLILILNVGKVIK